MLTEIATLRPSDPVPVLACMVVSEHNKSEWARMAQDAYRTDRNDYGHRYSAAASIPRGTMLTCARYEELQSIYRKWLVFGWKDVPPFGWDRVESA